MLIPIIDTHRVDPVIVIIQKAQEPKPPTLDEKIASNYYKCDTLTQWIRADNAECLDKPSPEPQITVTAPLNSSQATINVPAHTPHTSSGVNMYTPGQCTAYAWSRRPDLPGNLGNAYSWADNARAQGYVVSSVPIAGSIGVAKGYGHVVFVESVGDGVVNISEQNYKGPFIVSSRTTPISEFVYIY